MPQPCRPARGLPGDSAHVRAALWRYTGSAGKLWRKRPPALPDDVLAAHRQLLLVARRHLLPHLHPETHDGDLLRSFLAALAGRPGPVQPIPPVAGDVRLPVPLTPRAAGDECLAVPPDLPETVQPVPPVACDVRLLVPPAPRAAGDECPVAPPALPELAQPIPL
eukprot:6182400-Lingulodinium_polyedra.AAC.1